MSSAPALVATSFAWRRPPREWLVLLLIAGATLTPIYVVSSQDASRLCLTRAIVAGRLTVAPCVGKNIDRARYDGHIYSDKAPGMSLLALPAVELTGLSATRSWNFGRDLRVWAVRVLSGGIAFLVLVFALGRVAEGLYARTGGLVATTFAVGTLAGGLAATTFDEVTAAALGFSAFLLAWRGRPAIAGVLAGLAVLVEYQAALILAVLLMYVACAGVRGLIRFAAGALPGLLGLGLYDWAAFGSPLHVSYRYVANRYAHAQAQGLFGISWPRWHSVELVLVGDRGLLIASPVLVLAAAGLPLLARRHRREAAVCAAVTVCFLLLEFGYFLPYGGVSPGPRFLIPALPFLALGLAPAFARLRTLTATLALASVVASTAIALTWSWGSTLGYRQTIWGELARSVVGADRRLRHDLAGNILTSLGLSAGGAAFTVGACACLALTVALAANRSSLLQWPATKGEALAAAD